MADVSVRCSHCKGSIHVGEESETLVVDGEGGFICELCVNFEKDLSDTIAKVIVKHVIGRMVKRIKGNYCIACGIPLDPRCSGCYSCDDCEAERKDEHESNG